MIRIGACARRALPIALAILAACAPARTQIDLDALLRRPPSKPITILYAGRMAGKVEPCG